MEPSSGPPGDVRRKIHDLGALAKILSDHRAQGKRIAHCHGVFDLLHIGHVRHFEQASRLGDLLVVTLTPDRWVNKGPHRPAFHEDLRAEMLASLECIDYVALNQWPTAVETIQALRPDFFVKGSEFKGGNDVTGAISVEENAVKAAGGQMVFTEDVVFSSSALINRFLPRFTREGGEFLEGFGKRHSADALRDRIEALASLKVLVVGEAIIDEYHFVETLGKSGKEPILAVRLDAIEKYAGGNLAVANHVASFCKQVRLATYLGGDDVQEEFIRSHLHQRVLTDFFVQPATPTIRKRRYVERYPFQKLFEVYHIRDYDSSTAQSARFREALSRMLPEFDLVIVTDYGHGMLDREAVDLLCAKSPRLAVHAQANAGNKHLNTILKYGRADFVCLSEGELRLEFREQRLELEKIVQDLADRLGCRTLVVTRGNQGVLCYNRPEGFARVPAFASHLIDRMGAGEAVFAITALLAAQDAPAEVIGLAGNAAGAMAVESVGNRTAIERTPLLRFIVSLLK